MTQLLKFDWDTKRMEMLNKTNNNLKEMEKYILNEKNTKITKKFIEEVFNTSGISYEVYDIEIFKIAMTHPSYIHKDYREIKNLKSILMGINFLKGEDLIPISDKQIHMAIPLGEISYERLEYLGDSILRLIISDYLFTRYNDMDEGDLTKLRSQIENGSSLAEMTRKIGLHKYMLIPRNLEATGARDKNNKFQCDIFEAFIAAIYYDSLKIKYEDIGIKQKIIDIDRGSAYSLCFNLVKKLIESEIDLTMLLETETNHKDELLQTFHRKGWGDPKYNLMDTIINNEKMGKKSFKMYVRDNEGNIIGIGVGSSKQKGEKTAAKKALQYLNIIPNNNEDTILNNNSNEIYFRNENKFIKKKYINKNIFDSDNSDNSDNSDDSDDFNMTKNSDNSDNSDKTNKLSMAEKIKLSIIENKKIKKN
jgi:ribonuclease-3